MNVFFKIAIFFGLSAFSFMAAACRQCQKEDPPFPLHALLLFVPELSDRNLSFIGSVAIEPYAHSNLSYRNKEAFTELKEDDGWTKFTWSEAFLTTDSACRVSEEKVSLRVLKKDGFYQCDYIGFVEGSLGATSGSFWFSVEPRLLYYEGELREFDFIIYKGSVRSDISRFGKKKCF